jgi:hypothetical protein
VLELDLTQPDIVSGGRHALAGEKAAHRARRLLERTDRLRGQRADLLHPRRHTVADPGDEPPRVHPGKRRDLHRGRCRIAEDRGHDAQPDCDAARRRERGGARSDAAGEEAVLPEPELVETGCLCSDGEPGDPFRRPVCRIDDPEPHPQAPTGIYRSSI